MNEQRATLEVIAPSVDEAIEKGLSDLGLTREAVDVEVLDEGNRGLFGIGSRQARVRLTVIGEFEKETEMDHLSKPTVADDPSILERAEEQKEESPEDDDREINIVRETVHDLLEKMGVVAQITAYYGEPDENSRIRPLYVDIEGDDLSILIGKRSETLNALQYITRLIAGKELERSVLIVIDVEGYRARKEQQLQRLARRMAEQAISTGRRQVLEPMPPNERRIIHIELRQNSQVETESRGEEPYRKVTIYPVE